MVWSPLLDTWAPESDRCSPAVHANDGVSTICSGDGQSVRDGVILENVIWSPTRFLLTLVWKTIHFSLGAVKMGRIRVSKKKKKNQVYFLFFRMRIKETTFYHKTYIYILNIF